MERKPPCIIGGEDTESEAVHRLGLREWSSGEGEETELVQMPIGKMVRREGEIKGAIILYAHGVANGLVDY